MKTDLQNRMGIGDDAHVMSRGVTWSNDLVLLCTWPLVSSFLHTQEGRMLQCKNVERRRYYKML